MKPQLPKGWFVTALQEAESWSINAEIGEQDGARRNKAAIDAFHYLFLYLASRLRLRDEWLDPHCHICPFSTGIIEHSRKIAHSEFTLGISLDGWFIEAPLSHAYHMRYVGDDFWRQIARLSTIGTPKLQDDGCGSGFVNDKATKLARHKVSLVYSLARNFTLDAIGPDSDDVSAGTIHLSLPLDSPEPKVVEFFSEGLDALYRANYVLYRAGYLQRRAMLRRTAKENNWTPEMLESALSHCP